MKWTVERVLLERYSQLRNLELSASSKRQGLSFLDGVSRVLSGVVSASRKRLGEPRKLGLGKI